MYIQKKTYKRHLSTNTRNQQSLQGFGCQKCVRQDKSTKETFVHQKEPTEETYTKLGTMKATVHLTSTRFSSLM